MTKLSEYLHTAKAAEHLGVHHNTIRNLSCPWGTPDAPESGQWLPPIQKNRPGQVSFRRRQARNNDSVEIQIENPSENRIDHRRN
jgi:hypothetical protein